MRTILTASLMLASLLAPAAASASTSAAESTDSATAVRVSTGVVAPELVKNVSLQIPSDVAWQTLPTDAKVGVSMTVDTTGQTKNIQITKSLNPYWDARVVDALSKAQYHPATVSKSPVAMDVNLVVNIQR